MRLLFYLAISFLLLIVGCQGRAGDINNQKSVDIKAPVINKDGFEPLLSMADTKVFAIDTTQSSILWHCENHKGLVDLKGGKIFIRKEEPVGVYAEAITKTARDTSITYQLMKGTFNNVLQTVDFFDSAHYPLLKFKASDIQKNNGQYVVNGEISIRNIIHPIKLQLTAYSQKDGKLSLETADFPINRTLFGMELNSRSFPEKVKDFTFSDTFFVKVVLFAEAL